ncbi:uncharacterized protein LOC144026792 [Festucalex cinctus]
MEDTKWNAEAQPWQCHYKKNDRQLLAREEEVVFAPQARTSSVKQEVPENYHIREEEVCFQGLDEADIARSSTCVEREGEIKTKREPESSILTTKADGNQRNGFESDNHLGPLPHVEDDVESDSSDEDEAQQPLKSKRDNESDTCDTKYKIFCRVCHQRFQLWSHLRAHMPTHVTTQTKTSGEKTHSCSFCGKIFSKRHDVTRHVRMHATVKEFSCSECGKSFTFNQRLTLHMRVHTGEKPFPCSVCGKTFSVKVGLSKHMTTHTGEKPFSCSVCARRFSTLAGVNFHMRTHTGEKPFSCSVCTKSFTSTGNLQRHMRTHTGERPYSCSVCGLKFVQNEHLVAHMRTHTGEKTLSCGVCHQRFSRKQQADKHKCSGEISS